MYSALTERLLMRTVWSLLHGSNYSYSYSRTTSSDDAEAGQTEFAPFWGELISRSHQKGTLKNNKTDTD